MYGGNMNTFIPLVRNDRLREINTYKSKDYSFKLGEDKYIYTSKIEVNVDNNIYCFQVRDNQSELKFYICVADTCMYLTLPEIYDLLKQICDKVGTGLVKSILMGKRKKIVKLSYTGLEFEVNFFSKSIPNGEILMPESNIEIKYEYLFVLIALIQDKSNYLWMLSNQANKKYRNGILRLYACLISTKQNEFLEKLGWGFDLLNDKYYFMSEEEYREVNKPIFTRDIKGKDSRIKYYLTQKQCRDIINLEILETSLMTEI
jgi:hypothetical protein